MVNDYSLANQYILLLFDYEKLVLLLIRSLFYIMEYNKTRTKVIHKSVIQGFNNAMPESLMQKKLPFVTICGLQNSMAFAMFYVIFCASS